MLLPISLLLNAMRNWSLRSRAYSRMLTYGGKITMVGVSGTLNFEREMLAVREALALLAVDPDEP